MKNIKETKFVIVDGQVVDPASSCSSKLNVVIDNGIISNITSDALSKDFKTINAAGKIVSPGFIDLHVHLREPGFEYKEDIETGGQTAVAGGFTSIFCMPNTKPAIDSVKTVQLIKERASTVSPAEIFPVGAMTKGLGGKELSDLKGMAGKGVLAISDDGSCIQNSDLMKEAMLRAKESGLLVISHPEDFSISGAGVMNAGALADRLELKGILPAAEENIIERDIELARETGARLHIAHTSTAKGIELVRRAKASGVQVTCEVTPHHLLLTEEACATLDPNTKMNPPLRTEIDRQALIKGLQDGTVDAIATDHAPHAAEEKKTFKDAPFGIIGMETALPVCMKLVEEKLITVERLIELFTSGPASVVGLNRGRLNVGDPANITIFDPNSFYAIDSRAFKSKSRNCPFDGWKVTGKVCRTIINGKIVYEQ
jgi:dihydroorotase